MSSIDKVRLLDTIEKPDGLEVEIVGSASELMTRPVVLNEATLHWFGTAFVQGRRLQFTTSMPIQDYLNVTEFVRADRGSTVEDLRKASNRSKIASHERDIRTYLTETAFEGEKFIFPNFMVNFGANWSEGSPKAKLTLLVSKAETLAWPAVFEPPTGVRLSITDGAHRTGGLEELVHKHKNKAGVAALLANAVGVTVVMEETRDDAHQDFADCGRAKPIADSVIATWDKRNIVARFARDLVQDNSVLSKFVDATSPSVNLSSNSPGLWSMSAVRGSILSAFPPNFADLDPDGKTALLGAASGAVGSVRDEGVRQGAAVAGVDREAAVARRDPQGSRRLCPRARRGLRPSHARLSPRHDGGAIG